jgi:hypothetical protein
MQTPLAQILRFKPCSDVQEAELRQVGNWLIISMWPVNQQLKHLLEEQRLLVGGSTYHEEVSAGPKYGGLCLD